MPNPPPPPGFSLVGPPPPAGFTSASPKLQNAAKTYVDWMNTGAGDPLSGLVGTTLDLAGAAFPGLKPYLPNSDTAHQFVRQMTGNISDMAQAGIAAGAQGVHNLLHQPTLKDLVVGPEPSAGDVYNAVRQAQNARTQQYSSAANTAAGIAGGVAPLFLGAAGAPVKVAEAAAMVRKVGMTRALLAAAPRVAKGMAVGAGLGGASGAANAPTWQDIPQSAKTGAEIGAAIVPAVGVIGAGLRTPLAQGVVRRVAAAGSAVGQGMKNAFVHAPLEADPAAVEASTPQAAEIVHGMLTRAGKTVDDLANHPDVPRDVTAAEAIGPEAINRVTGLSRRPGSTANLAQPLLEGRSGNALQRFSGDVHSATNISPEEARESVDGMVSQGQAEVKPMFEAALAQPVPVIGGDLPKLVQEAPVDRAMKNVQSWMRLAGLDDKAPTIALDPDTGMQLTGDDLKSLVQQAPTPRAWDLVRREMKQLIEVDPQTGQPILDGDRGGANRLKIAAYQRLTQNLRQQIPGYGDALDASANYLKVRDAYNRSASMLNQGTTAKQVNDFAAGLSDPERRAVQLSFARQLYDMIDKGTMRPSVFEGYGQGMRENIAGKLATVFSPSVAEKLSGAATTERQLQSAAARMAPLSNSTTGAGLEVDPNGPVAANMTKQLAQGNFKGAGMMALFGPAGRAVAAPGEIALRDATGKLLLMRPPQLADVLRNLPPRRPFVSLGGASQVAPLQTGLLDQQNQQ